MTEEGPDRVPLFSTVAQVADRHQTTERQVRRWIKAGELVVHRFGRLVRIHRNDLEIFEKLRRCS